MLNMELSYEIRRRMEAATRNFVCPICGNQQIYLSSELSVKPYYKFGAESPSELVNTVAGHCACCGFIMEFNLETLMKGDDPR